MEFEMLECKAGWFFLGAKLTSFFLKAFPDVLYLSHMFLKYCGLTFEQNGRLPRCNYLYCDVCYSILKFSCW